MMRKRPLITIPAFLSPCVSWMNSCSPVLPLTSWFSSFSFPYSNLPWVQSSHLMYSMLQWLSKVLLVVSSCDLSHCSVLGVVSVPIPLSLFLAGNMLILHSSPPHHPSLWNLIQFSICQVLMDCCTCICSPALLAYFVHCPDSCSAPLVLVLQRIVNVVAHRDSLIFSNQPSIQEYNLSCLSTSTSVLSLLSFV